jgi:DNA-binding transcriptional ArsR family regulator
MRSDAPALLPILRSRHQAELLAAFLLHPERGYTLTELSALLSVPASTLHREVERLLEAELITAQQVGRSRLLRVNPTNRHVEPLTTLVVGAFGPHLVVAEEFAGIAGIESLLVYGSWAARYHGTAGPPPHDVDLLVVGKPDRSDVYDAAARASDRIGYPVHPTIRSPKQWHEAADALTRQIKASAIVAVPCGDGDVSE